MDAEVAGKNPKNMEAKPKAKTMKMDTLVRSSLAPLLPEDVHEDFKHLPEDHGVSSEDAGESEEKPVEQESEAESEEHDNELLDIAREVDAELRKCSSRNPK